MSTSAKRGLAFLAPFNELLRRECYGTLLNFEALMLAWQPFALEPCQEFHLVSDLIETLRRTLTTGKNYVPI